MKLAPPEARQVDEGKAERLSRYLELCWTTDEISTISETELSGEV
jgi:hypothetical protein